VYKTDIAVTYLSINHARRYPGLPVARTIKRVASHDSHLLIARAKRAKAACPQVQR